MRFLRDNWFNLALVAFAATAIGVTALGPDLDATQRILLVSLMALPLHQYEEYALPGGGPVVINRYFWGEKDNYRAFPGNWASVTVVNLSAYVFYILALAFPGLVWLGLATMFFNLYQVLGHCVQMNLKMGTWYNPGMATSVLLFLPISVWYIWTVVSTGVAAPADWVLGALAFVGIAACSVVLPIQAMKDPASPHLIPQWQVDQLEKIRAVCSVRRGR